MLRPNPALRRRDFAAGMVIDLAGKFGMSPADRYKILALKNRVPDNDLLENPLGQLSVAPAVGETATEEAKPSRWDELLGPRVRSN